MGLWQLLPLKSWSSVSISIFQGEFMVWGSEIRTKSWVKFRAGRENVTIFDVTQPLATQPSLCISLEDRTWSISQAQHSTRFIFRMDRKQPYLIIFRGMYNDVSGS